MVSQVGSLSMQNYGINPLNTLNPLTTSNTASSTSNLLNFGSNPLLTSGNSYEDDMFMPDSLKMTSQTTTSVQTQTLLDGSTQGQQSQKSAASVQSQASVPQTEQAQSGLQTETSGQENTEDLSSLNGCLSQSDDSTGVTDSGNSYKKANSGKILGAGIGFLAPLSGKIAQVIKGGKISKVFNLKQLVTTCPMIAIAGFGIGYLIDQCRNSNRAKAADEAAKLAASAKMNTPVINTLA